MVKRLWFITGRPGMGKTTVLWKTIEGLRDRGYQVGGMVSREVREHGTRVGFQVLDLIRGREGWLAHVNQKHGPRVGKYRVNLDDLESIGVQAVIDAVENADVIAIDEIGPMELYSEGFKEAVRRGMDSGKPVLGTVHHSARDKLIEEIKGREDAEIVEVTYHNRETLHRTIVEKASQFLA